MTTTTCELWYVGWVVYIACCELSTELTTTPVEQRLLLSTHMDCHTHTHMRKYCAIHNTVCVKLASYWRSTHIYMQLVSTVKCITEVQT